MTKTKTQRLGLELHFIDLPKLWVVMELTTLASRKTIFFKYELQNRYMKVKELKTLITVRIESYFVDQAHRLGLNISQISRNTIEEIINKSKASYSMKAVFSGVKECFVEICGPCNRLGRPIGSNLKVPNEKGK